MPALHLTRRGFMRLSAASGAALYLGGCGSPAPAARTVRLPGGSFGFPSPFAYIAGIGYVQMSYLYDSLLWKDSTGRLLPWLARSYARSPDGRTYTFQLRDGIRWHDGRPLTADDVAFTFEYFGEQSLGPLLVAQPYGVSGARALSRLAVEVRLAAPVVTFADRVAGAVPIIPRHVWSTIKDAPQAQSRKVLVGTGPYTLQSFSPGEGSYLFVANDDYFLGAPYIRRIELRPVEDEFSALRAGEIDVAASDVSGVGPDALAPFRSDAAYGVIGDTGTFTFPLIWNIGRGGALADLRFRRACTLAIDRNAIVTRLLGGNGAAGNPGWLPPSHRYHTAVAQYPFDLAAANRLLDGAGYGRTSAGLRSDERGRPLRFALLTGNSPIPPVLDLVIQGLKKIGVELKAQAVDLPSMFGRLQSEQDDVALSLYPGPGGSSLASDPDTLRAFFSSRVKDRLQGAQGWKDPEFDRLAARQLVTADIAARKAIIARMQTIVARDLPVLPLYYPTLFTVYRREVFDRWYVTPGGFAGGLEGVHNKQVLVTGSKTGTTIRRN
jgi:peptide/nickel transport system substrate-binding protein